MQKNLVLLAWAARDGLGWHPGIVRRFPGSNHNFHITPPRLGFLPGRFSFPWDMLPGLDRKRRPADAQRLPGYDTGPLSAGLLMLLSWEPPGGRISAFSRGAIHILKNQINAAAAILRPLVGNPDALRSIGRRRAGRPK